MKRALRKPYLTEKAMNLRRQMIKDYFTDGNKKISQDTFSRITRGETATLPMIHRALDLLGVPDGNRDAYIEWR